MITVLKLEEKTKKGRKDKNEISFLFKEKDNAKMSIKFSYANKIIILIFDNINFHINYRKVSFVFY